ncbi:transcription antitermination factor NusB, partial [Methylorubrum podarium]|uniref:transcription antitermination factor NusB n=1 Tax=Methylorubrum podarium TaxID=200476 RepID=UPI0024B5F95A
MASPPKSRTPPSFDPSVPGLAARHVAREAVATLLGPARGLALEDALAQAGRGARLEPGEAALARAIATASFRRLGFIRAALASRLRDGLPEDRPHLLALLVTGAAQILDLAVADHAAVDLSVRLAKADPQIQHLAPLVNAVLRRIARERDTIRAEEIDPLAHNTPDWLARRWRKAYGEEAARRIAAD